MKILCLDQATYITGYALFDNGKLKKYGVLEGVQSKNSYERVRSMYFLIRNLIDKLSPDFVVLEDIQFQRNQSVYKQLAQIQGSIFSHLFEKDLGFILVPPSVWKNYSKIQGKKRQEQKENTIKFVLDNFKKSVTEDEADAIVMGVYAITIILGKKE